MTEDWRHYEDEISQLSPDISRAALQTLSRMYASKTLDGTERQAVEIGRSMISPRQGSELRRILREANARSTMEIGFAFGFSTIWILDAIGEQGRHIAVDPYEKPGYGGAGLKQVRDTEGFAERFEWREALSIHQLSEFIKEARTFDAIFIDGNHRFDDVIVDFYLSDYLLKVGGIVALDDMWMTAIQTATAFITSNRQYEIVETEEPNMLVLRKVEQDTRNWDHFVPFRPPVPDEADRSDEDMAPKPVDVPKRWSLFPFARR